METVCDINRLDVNGVAPKMQRIADQLQKAIKGKLPYIKVKCDDNMVSSVTLRCSLDAPQTWNYGIYENSRYFRFSLTPQQGKRYYNEGENVMVTLKRSYKITKKFRTSITPPEKAIERIVAFINSLTTL